MSAKFFCTIFCSLAVFGTAFAEEEAKARPEPQRWEKTIGKFLQSDAEAPPAKGGILFIGSSSIRMWDTKRWFPQRTIINRGFGGSWIQDSLHYADKIIFPYAPKTIVLYAGDNDVGGGLKAPAVFADYVKFAEKVHQELPETEIIFIAIKPSIKRWQLWPEMKRANDLVAERCQSQPLERFADIAPLLLGEDGKPAAKYFVEDGLHLSEAGYQSWTKLLESMLNKNSES